jgi:hypothetical protein
VLSGDLHQRTCLKVSVGRAWEDNVDLKEIGINVRNGLSALRIGIIGKPL